MRQSFQFKLFGGKRLKRLHRTIDVSAEIWNHSIALHRRYYRLFKKTLPKAKLQAHLAKLRNGKVSHWQALGSQSVQAITDRLYLAWEAFFEATSRGRRRSGSAGNTDRSHSSNADTRSLDMGESRFLAGTIGSTKAGQ